MSDLINFVEYLGIPNAVAIIFVAAFFIIQAIGEVLEFFGKIVPEWVKVRKWFKRRKQEKKTIADVMAMMPEVKAACAIIPELKASLEDFNSHYSIDNIKKRDAWMKGVDDHLAQTDANYLAIVEKLDKNTSATLSILIENKRSFILSFASYIADEKHPVTHEQYRRAFKTHQEYEEILKENGLTNGETDIAYRIICESYQKRLENHAFLEDAYGY